MNYTIISQTAVGDTTLVYFKDGDGGCVEFCICPKGMETLLQPADNDILAPLAFVHFAGDSNGIAFSAGRSMRYGGTNEAFRLLRQESNANRILTVLEHDSGCILEHVVEWKNDVPVFYVHTNLDNRSNETITVELLESFNIGGIGRNLSNPEHAQMKIHRFRSHWSSEAYHECRSVGDMHLERYEYVANSERFGQVGTMPVRGFHPFCAVEETANNVVWGAQLAWSGSWQLEISSRQNAGLSLGGGIADYEFGHWRKNLQKGERLASPTAIVACIHGGFDKLCARIVRGIEQTLAVPEVEKELPVVFNEWCTSWGNPSTKSLTELADVVSKLGVKYLVIDAGWYRQPNSDWSCAQGDWRVNCEQFPNGITEAVNNIRKRNLIPGIWFEAETVGSSSDAYNEYTDLMLRDCGRLINAGPRRFWDLRKSETRRLLEERVVNFIKENGFGYIKIDYNALPGVGCDDADSPGEGLRQQVLGTHWLFKRLAEVNPDLVIENCASGGHRLEPAMLALSAMSSFSDAHEKVTIPAIAASLHRLMPPRQIQIWAVMRKEADSKRIAYLMTSAMMGRICLSGDIAQLDEAQLSLVENALEFYRKIVPIINNGDSTFFPSEIPFRSELRGGQALLRVSHDGTKAAVFFHVFNEPPELMRCPLPTGKWSVDGVYQAAGSGEVVSDGKDLTLKSPAPFSGFAVLISRLR